MSEDVPVAAPSMAGNDPTEALRLLTNHLLLGASFPNEPPLADESDYGVIQAYYANLKEKGQAVSATLFLAHLENKVPVSHQCDFVEVHDRYQDRDSPYVIDWDVYDDCVKSILRNVPTPTITQFLRTKQKELGAAKPKQIKLLVASVTSYQKLYPDESIGWKAVFRFFFNEFRATSLVVFQMKQFRCIHKYLTEDTPLPNKEELWKEFSTELIECSPFSLTTSENSPSNRPSTNNQAKPSKGSDSRPSGNNSAKNSRSTSSSSLLEA